MTTAWPAPFRRIGPAVPISPVVIAVPHAGTHYPATLLAEAAVPRTVLEQLEDRHADRLTEVAVEHGAVAIVGAFARAWIDLNRGPEDADTAGAATGPSARARSGLGLVPTRLGGRPLVRRALDAATMAERLRTVHEPYHRAVADALAAAARVFGHAVLVDCHSMPPLRGGAQVVLGDLHGRSATPAVTEAAQVAAERVGFRVSRNRPYAGAYTLARHGRPTGVDAIQVEVDRASYLDAAFREPSPGLAQAAGMMAALCRAVAAVRFPSAIAAE